MAGACLSDGDFLACEGGAFLNLPPACVNNEEQTAPFAPQFYFLDGC